MFMRRAPLVAVTALTLLLAACSARFNWREVHGPDRGFVVALPDKPQTVTREISFAHATGPVSAQMVMLSTGVGASLFAVGTVQLPLRTIEPAAALQQTLVWFSEGLARNVGAAPPPLGEAAPPPGVGSRRLRSTQAFSVPGTAGQDGRRARLAARLYVVDDRLYQLVVISAEGEVTPQALETFFDSFQLTAQ